jgi:methyl-accepting chemotaxis protein
MNAWNTMSLAKRLALSFGTLIGIALVVSSLGYWLAAKQVVMAERVAGEEVPAMTAGHALVYGITAARADLRSYLIFGEQRYRDELAHDWDSVVAPALTELVKDTTKLDDEVSKAGVAKLQALLPRLRAAQEKVASLVANEAEAERVLLEEAGPMGRDAETTAESLVAGFAKTLQEEAKAMHAQSLEQEAVLLGGLVIALLVGVALATLVTRSVLKTLGADPLRLASVARTLSTGDLTVDLTTKGEATGVFADLKLMTNNLRHVIRQAQTAATTVNQGADEVARGSTDLSQRTEEQASSLEETASAMEQMTSTVRQNADNAGQASQLAMAAREQADKGGGVVASAVRAMTEINASSKKIADIISVIDEIAFQTNLLALNAAVEAARAGEQGRGFAVVASEVRNLAGRSATAAKEIKGLIQDSVKKVDDGSALVTQSGQSLEQIVTAVKKVADIVSEISAASQEQSSAIEEVNKAVMQLDELTQQNAALVEETAAASQNMAEQARSTRELLGRYRIADGDEMSMPIPSAAISRPAAKPLASLNDRRTAKRPWSASKPKAAAAPPAASAPMAATGTDDTEWKEF